MCSTTHFPNHTRDTVVVVLRDQDLATATSLNSHHISVLPASSRLDAIYLRQSTTSPEISETLHPMTRLQAGNDHGSGTDQPGGRQPPVEKAMGVSSSKDHENGDLGSTRWRTGVNVVSKRVAACTSEILGGRRHPSDSATAPHAHLYFGLTRFSGGGGPYFLIARNKL
jgi:hypothetical protein